MTIMHLAEFELVMKKGRWWATFYEFERNKKVLSAWPRVTALETYDKNNGKWRRL